MIRLSVGLIPLLLAASAGPAFAQSHAGHAPAPVTARPAAPLPAGCVRRGAPTAAPARAGTPGAPACPAGSVPERAPAADPHAGHDMSAMGQASPSPAGHDMSTMQAGQRPASTTGADPHAGHGMPTMGQNRPAPPDPHAGHDMSTMRAGPQSAPATQADPHAGHDMSGAATPPEAPTSADNPGRPPEAAPPPGAARGPSHAADLLFDPVEMAAAREQLRVENGDVRTTAVIIDQLEATAAEGEEGYAWDAQGWSGGDINRFWWKSEGEGAFGDEVEEAEIQALYSRAIRPFFDVQAGLRQTWRPEGDRTDLVVGLQGLAPHWFEVDAAAFLSSEGDLTARGEAEYDQRITRRWILQPRAEVVLSAQDVPELSIGSGLSSLQIGARLRYEIRKEFAPYIGVEWTRSFGATRDFLEADGRSAEDTRLVAGIRAWF